MHTAIQPVFFSKPVQPSATAYKQLLQRRASKGMMLRFSRPLLSVVVMMLCLVFTHLPRAKAQERGPLSMRVHFLATAGGLAVGTLIGVAVWLTDPGDPNNQLSDAALLGAAWGAVIGAGVGIVVLQNTAVFPYGNAQNALPSTLNTVYYAPPDKNTVSLVQPRGHSVSGDYAETLDTTLSLAGQKTTADPPLKAVSSYSIADSANPDAPTTEIPGTSLNWVVVPAVMGGQLGLRLHAWF